MPYVLPESASAFGPAGYGHVRKQHGFTLIKQGLHQRLRGAHFTQADRMHPYRLLQGAWAAVTPKARTRAHAPVASGTPRAQCHPRSEEHTSELQSLMRTSYAVFCLKKKKNNHNRHNT